MRSALPSEHRVLFLEHRESGFQVITRATPQPSHGSAVIRIAAAAILPYHRDVYSGKRPLPFPTPLVGGFSAIGHVAAVGPDATALKSGQLVYIDCVIRARDDPDCSFLSAYFHGFSDGSIKLMRDMWRDGTYAEYAKVPLENCIPLNESRLCDGLGYSLQDMMYMAYLLVPYGGLRDIKLEPGETIIICPATGFYSGFAVQVAITMGARVIAMGRNEEKLANLKEQVQQRSPGADIETSKITGDEQKDASALQAFGPVDAVFDITPSAASMSTHTRSAIKALRRGGRVSLMGSTRNISVQEIMMNDITLKGKSMYERETILQFVKMLQRGLFPIGKGSVETKAFALDKWKEALDVGADHNGIGKCVVFTPVSS
ncbi:putative quinone oxidoreductase [Aspergillus bombycis]|uniref:Putative quinone oxidoreductase n=1 Tax=Aspergillus bombycis TaxID=109264 RepID=A0A1F7ZTH5_9EURO|nr:putative quinone oxidoreductase [Aspergillus bombycis]OGM42388.1 putative quinone oxidoreductase [Aspergillus bombycis]